MTQDWPWRTSDTYNSTVFEGSFPEGQGHELQVGTAEKPDCPFIIFTVTIFSEVFNVQKSMHVVELN